MLCWIKKSFKKLEDYTFSWAEPESVGVAHSEPSIFHGPHNLPPEPGGHGSKNGQLGKIPGDAQAQTRTTGRCQGRQECARATHGP